MMALYFESSPNRLSEHHLDSYDDFVGRKISLIIEGGNEGFVMIKNDEGDGKEKRFQVRVSDVTVTQPLVSVEGDAYRPMLPNLARALDRSYLSEVLADVTVTVTVGDEPHGETLFPGVRIASLPLMLHSRHCYLRGRPDDFLAASGEDPDDPGGYFIVEGKERVIVAQERTVQNTPVVSLTTDPNGRPVYELMYRGAPMDDVLEPVVLRLYAEEARDGVVVKVLLPRIDAKLPLTTVFRAMGVETDRAIAEHVLGGDIHSDSAARLLLVLRPSLAAGAGVMTRDAALDALAPLTPYGINAARSPALARQRGRDQALYILARQFLPGRDASMAPKALMLGYLARRLIRAATGEAPLTDRENFAHRRLDTSGAKLTEVFAEAYAEMKRNAVNRMDFHYNYGPWKTTGKLTQVINADNLADVFDPYIVSDILLASFKGDWGGRHDPDEGGVVQDLDRRSYLGFVSHLRRVNNPLSRDLKLVPPRRLHATQWGAVCPVESPDGGGIGLTKNLALLCRVTSDTPAAPAVAAVEALGGVDVASVPLRELGKSTLVFINGVMTHAHDDAGKLVAALRRMRAAAELDRMTTVYWDIVQREVRVYTDGGRCVRPLARVVPGGKKTEAAEPGASKKTEGGAAAPAWDALFESRLEYLDVLETLNALIAMRPEEVTYAPAAVGAKGGKRGRPRQTHIELHPLGALSAYSATIPFINHNQSPRNVYSAAQGKQAASLYSSAFRHRIEYDVGFLLNAPQLPLVHTGMEGALRLRRHPYGQNAIVAVVCNTGFNQEDAVIFNRAALERGLFTTTHFKSQSVREDASMGQRLVFDERGAFPEINTVLAKGDPIARMRKLTTVDAGVSDRMLVSPASAAAASGAEEYAAGEAADVKTPKSLAGYSVDRVVTQTQRGSFGRTLGGAKLRFRKQLVPDIGDKFSSRHAQKGVVGCVLPPEQMPYTRDGITPDLIINPHAFPSRMTVGHMLECVAAKAACCGTGRAAADAFEPFDWDAAHAALQAHGLHRAAEERLYDGTTGAPFADTVFIGPTYYMRLKHIAGEKLNVRASKMEAPVEAITRQPVQGKAKDGGLRLGEMERDVLLSYGMMGMIGESFTGRSDGTTVWLDAAGNTPHYNEDTDEFRSVTDPEDLEFTRHTMPYSLNVLRHELAQMGLDMRPQTRDAADDEVWRLEHDSLGHGQTENN